MKIRPSSYMSFMNLHNKCSIIPIFFNRKLLNTTHWYHSLHSILTIKSTNMCIIFFYISFTSTYNQHMYISSSKIRPFRGSRRSRPIKPIRIFICKNIRYSLFKYREIPSPYEIFLCLCLPTLPSPFLPTNIHLIITIPYCY
jgi:hypothetical protein